MLGKGFSHSLGQTLGKVLARGASSLNYVKDNLKAYFDFKNTDLEHVGTGSANISTPSDGSGDWIEYTDATLLDAMEGIDTLTIMGWVRRDDNTGFAFITKGGYYGSNTDWGSEWQAGNGRMRFSIEQNFTAWEPPPDTYINTWVHYAITYDKNCEGGNKHRVVNTYYNGDQDYGYGSGTPATVGTNGNNIRIGATSTGVGPLRGNIKNVGIWNRVLSKEEVRNVMYKSYSDLKGSELTNLQLWADLDTDFNGKDGNGRTITGSAAGNANIMQGLYGNNLPIMPRGVDNSKAALADQIGSGSAVFDASSNEYIRCGVSGLSSLSLGTAACWFKISGDSGAHMALFSINDESGSGDFATLRLIRGSSTSYTISARVHNEGSSLLYPTNSTNVMDNKWHHIAWVVGSSSNKIYLDGAKLTLSYSEGSQSSSTQKFFSDVADADVFAIGSTKGTNPANEFEGNIAQVGVWSVALSQEEIQSIKEKTYSELTTSEKTNLVSWWGLDEVFLGANTNVSPLSGTLYQTGQIVEDKNGSLITIIEDTFSSLDNWETSDSNGTLSLNSDGNMLVTAAGGTAQALLKSNVVNLETSTNYLAEIGIAGGTDTSINVRLDDEAYGDTKYGNGYSNASIGTNETPVHFAISFTSDSSNTGFYLRIGGINDGSTAIVSSFKLFKVVSGNYGTLI